MKTRYDELWQSRAPWERTLLVIILMLLGAALYLWLVLFASHARSRLIAELPIQKVLAVRMEQQSSEYARLLRTPNMPAAKSDLRPLLQSQLEVAGLSQALVRMDSKDANQVQAVFDNVPFSEWLAWIAKLQSLHIRLDACRIEAKTQPGLVSVTATLVRSMPP